MGQAGPGHSELASGVLQGSVHGLPRGALAQGGGLEETRIPGLWSREARGAPSACPSEATEWGKVHEGAHSLPRVHRATCLQHLPGRLPLPPPPLPRPAAT